MKCDQFFSNGGTNLHTSFSATHKITSKMVLLSSVTLKTWVLTPFLCRDLYYCPAINRYTFFGNGGASLHTKLSETHQITLKIVSFSSLTFKIRV